MPASSGQLATAAWQARLKDGSLAGEWNTRRDTHLRSADFFDSDNHPDLTFSTGTVRLSGPGATVTGALTVRGVTRPLSFDAVVAGRGDGEAGLDAEVRINRADFGLSWNVLGLASMMAVVTIHATFTATGA